VSTTTAPSPPSPTPPPSRRRPRRVPYIVAAVLCVVAVAALLFLGLRGNIVYFRTVSEAVKTRQTEGTHRFRLAGAVLPGSIHETPTGVRFTLTDGKKQVVVDHTGDPPELFKPRAPVVCEGRWGKGLTFDSDRILIKHGSEYTPPKVKIKQSAAARRGRQSEAEYTPPKVKINGGSST
jgi:cytochrome c-type biogenesis protein CcmE